METVLRHVCKSVLLSFAHASVHDLRSAVNHGKVSSVQRMRFCSSGLAKVFNKALEDLLADSEEGKCRLGERLEKMIRKAKSERASGRPVSDWGYQSHCFTPSTSSPMHCFERRTWVPQIMNSMGYVPDDLQNLGSPWLMAQWPGTQRTGNTDWVFEGLAKLLFNISPHPLVALCFKTTQLLDIGPDTCTFGTFLENMKNTEFAAFSNRFKHFVLRKDEVAFIPCGYSVTIVAPFTANFDSKRGSTTGNTEQGPDNVWSFFVSLPFVSHALLKDSLPKSDIELIQRQALIFTRPRSLRCAVFLCWPLEKIHYSKQSKVGLGWSIESSFC